MAESTPVAPSALVAGTCASCRHLLWRSYPHPLTGEPVILWPSPESLYARIATPEGVAVGIGYCPRCAPPPDDVILSYERAGDRYTNWFSPAFGDHIRAQVREPQLRLPEALQTALIAQWEEDVAAVRA